MGNEGGLRPWVNFIWLPPDFRVIICDGNGIISPARGTRFKYDHIFSHPSVESRCTFHKNWKLTRERVELTVSRQTRKRFISGKKKKSSHHRTKQNQLINFAYMNVRLWSRERVCLSIFSNEISKSFLSNDVIEFRWSIIFYSPSPAFSFPPIIFPFPPHQHHSTPLSPPPPLPFPLFHPQNQRTWST